MSSSPSSQPISDMLAIVDRASQQRDALGRELSSMIEAYMLDAYAADASAASRRVRASANCIATLRGIAIDCLIRHFLVQEETGSYAQQTAALNFVAAISDSVPTIKIVEV